MFEHREADRVPITDSPWAGTLMRRNTVSLDRYRRIVETVKRAGVY
jgi:hypothetical protein